jgi:antirestriction protein ArdC/phage/plasmid primase-like uncharacterized protein
MSDQTNVIHDSGQLPGPLTLERTKQLVHEFCKIYPVAYAIKFKIRATQEELYGPNATRANIGTVFGAHVPATEADRRVSPVYRGRCDLAYSVLGGDEDLRKTLRHEIIGHFGLNTLSADDKRGVLESIALSQGRDGIAQKWAQARRDYGSQPDLLIAEEVFCLYAENLDHLLPSVVQPPAALERIKSSGAQALDAQDINIIAAHIATGLHERTRDQVIFPIDRRAQFSRTASDKADKTPFHDVVASELIRQIEAGTAPWQKPWNADGGIGGMPLNPTTGKRYKGINAIHLLAQGHSDPRWLTYKQAVSLDAQVRKGERGTSIQYWKFEDTRIKTDAAGNPVMGPDGAPVQERVKLQNPRVFYATVFNAEQIDGLAPLVTPALTWDPVERAEQILANSGARIEHAATDRAYYSPSRDEIHLPLQAQFPTARNYYATALHELGHWTGHESRLKRDLSHPFRSEGYAREELRAEIASMMLSAELGLPHDPSQHAAYVASWVSVLKKDPLEIFRAAADAEKIHALAMSFAPELSQDVPSVLAVIGPAPSLPPSPAPKTQAQETRPSAQQERSLTTGPVSNLTPDTTKVIAMPRQPLSADDVRDALSYISPNLPRDDWARIGMALKSEFPKDLGLDLFDQWSSTGEGYDRNSVVSTWRSIRADGPVSIGTLLKQAKDNGFTPREPIESMQTRRNLNDPQAAAQRAADAAAQEQVRLNQQETAAVQALAMWDQATPDVTSAYLERKSVQAHGTRTTDQGTLLVPLVDQDGKLWNVQRVLPRKMQNGTDKLYLKGGRKSGLFHVIGSLNSALDAGQPVVIAEGYATAASAHEATGWPCVVSFDSGNLIKVTEQFRKRYPDALLVVAGDDDLPTFAKKGINPGRDKATLAAQKGSTALAFPLGLNPDQSDFNDLVAQWGPETGPQKIRASFEAALLEYVSPQQPQSASLAVDGGSPSGQLTAQQALAVKALNELKALDLHLSQAVSIENAPKIRSESVSVATAIPPVDETKSPVQPLPRFEVRRVGDFNEEQIGQFGQLSGAVYFAAGQDDAQALQIHLNGARLQGPELTAYLDAVVLERTTPAHSPGAQQLTQLHAAALAVTVSETSDVQQPLPYTVTRTERGLAEKIGEFNQLSSAVYFAAGQDDAKSLHIHHNGTPLEGPQLSAYLDATVLERTSPASSLGKDRLAQLHAAALPKEVQVGAANAVGAVAVQTETPIPTSTGADNPGFNPAKTPAANSSPLAPPQTPTETGAPKADPLTRPDPNNDLNLEALQAKRARDAEQVRQEMGRLGTPPKQTGSSADAPNAPPGLNSISSAEPTPEPGPDTYLYQELRDLRERLAKEYQHDGAGKYFFRQGKLDLAFEDTGSKLNTAHHVPEVVASIAQLAHAKGWREMHVNGTVEFRREMWLQASLLNIKVMGYVPEAIDQVRLAERRQVQAMDMASKGAVGGLANSVAPSAMPQPETAGQASPPVNIAPSPQPVKSTPAPSLLSAAAAKQLDAQLRDVMAQKGATDSQAMEKTLGKLYDQVQSPRVYLGQLIEHGPAPYKFDPQEQSSYFVKLQTKTGLQTVWGVDLPRALAEMLPDEHNGIGQDILLAFQGIKKVQALVPQKDAAGLPAGEIWETVDRNTWFAQPVMQAYAQSLKELAQMPTPRVSDTQKATDAPPPVATNANSQAGLAVPAKPVQAMKPALPPAERLRNALIQLGADPLQSEITLASMQNLFDSPKFQVGTLLEHGQAPLKFTQGEPLSYYLKLGTEQGPVLLWSADFPRAINNTPVLLGQTVVAAYRGIDLVQAGSQPPKARNDWLVAPLERLHEDAQQGVIQRMTNAQVMPQALSPGASASQEQQALYILREAMRQAGIPQEFAQATLKDAENMLGTTQSPLPKSHVLPGQSAAQGISGQTSPNVQQRSPAPSVSKKVGPSL